VCVGEAFEQMAGDLLGFVEPALVDEIDGGIGIGGELVLGIVGVEFVEAVDDVHVDDGAPCGSGKALVLELGGHILVEAAAFVLLAAATRAGIIASGLGHHGLPFDRKDASFVRALLADARFHELLLAFDRDLAAAARAAGCARCGGVVHSAGFRRKPRGGPGGLGEEYAQRFSFCCAVDLCRSRKTPPSFRFLGRKAWLGAVVVLVAAMRQEATATRQLTELFGVSRRTIGRWRTWWGSAFAASPFWKVAAAAAFMPPVDRGRLPASLLERFAGDAAARLVALLRFILPISGGAAMHAA